MAEKSRAVFFGARRKFACDAICAGAMPEELRQQSLKAWIQTREPIRVRNIVLHGGNAPIRTPHGKTVNGFFKLKDSKADGEHSLLLWKATHEPAGAWRAGKRLDELHL